MSKAAPPATTDPEMDARTGKFGDQVLVLSIYTDGTFIQAITHDTNVKDKEIIFQTSFSVTKFAATPGSLSGDLTTGGPMDSFGQKFNTDLTFKVAGAP